MSKYNIWQEDGEQSPNIIYGHPSWYSRTMDAKVSICRREITVQGKCGNEFRLYFRDSDAGFDLSTPMELPHRDPAKRTNADILNAVPALLLYQLTLMKTVVERLVSKLSSLRPCLIPLRTPCRRTEGLCPGCGTALGHGRPSQSSHPSSTAQRALSSTTCGCQRT